MFEQDILPAQTVLTALRNSRSAHPVQTLDGYDHAILQALDLPLFVPREQEVVVPSHRFIVLVEEIQAAFGSAHQEQLQKIMLFLKQSDYLLLFADSDFNCKAQILLHFGALQALPQATQVVQTHSISTMLADPASKKQVLHDLQSLKP